MKRYMVIMVVLNIAVGLGIMLTGCVCGDGLDPRCGVWCDKNDSVCSCKWCMPQCECTEEKCLILK